MLQCSATRLTISYNYEASTFRGQLLRLLLDSKCIEQNNKFLSISFDDLKDLLKIHFKGEKITSPSLLELKSCILRKVIYSTLLTLASSEFTFKTLLKRLLNFQALSFSSSHSFRSFLQQQVKLDCLFRCDSICRIAHVCLSVCLSFCQWF